MQVSESELKKFIIDSGLVSRKDLDVADDEAKRRKQSVGDILVSEGALSEDALRRVKGYVLGVPWVHLKNKKISLDVFSLIPEPVARARSMVAYSHEKEGVEIAVLDTEDLVAVSDVFKKAGLKILPRLTDSESMKGALIRYQKLLKEEFGDLISSESGKINLIKSTQKNGEEYNLEKIAEDLPIVRIVDTLLRHAVLQGASDIHIEDSEDSVLVRYRINGTLHDAMTLPHDAGVGIAARIKMLAALVLEEQSVPQDGQFKMEHNGIKVSFRVSLVPVYFGTKIVMRILREAGEGYTLESLGFHGSSLEDIHAALAQASGIILVAGPKKSGKTTTLYTLLDLVNTPAVNISSIEDPVERQMKRVNQTQVNETVGLTFSNGLRALLRQDPDIVMVGEIRDAETASLVLSAAHSGRLLLATIEADSAADAITHLLDMGIDATLLASTLRVVIGQKLVRGLGEEKTSAYMSADERIKIGHAAHLEATLDTLLEEGLVKRGTTMSDMMYFNPSPSSAAPYVGYIGVHELLNVSPAIRELMVNDATTEAIETQARTEGMLTTLEDGLYKAVRGTTSLQEVLRLVIG